MFLPGGGQDPGEQRWRELAFEYVKTMIEGGLDVLLLAIPLVNLNENDLFFPLRDLFHGCLSTPYINVVFGVNRLVRGHVLSGLKRMQSLTNAKRGLSQGPDDLEEPGSIPDFVRLYTIGVKNVALIGNWPRELIEEEVTALKRYYWVCSHGEYPNCPVIHDPVDAARFTGLLRYLQGLTSSW